MNEHDFDLFDIHPFEQARTGRVQIAAAGVNATATVGAIGDGSRGYVGTAGPSVDRALQAELAELVRELRGALGGERGYGRHGRGASRVN
ncbi:hypothetical protein [Glycomyces sp. NPDC047010]|uniref:hypothetical protein n=1 Tax=Glycomyces sp. NPDC047010 TaxID=3155023 RepID=UPI0033FE97B0